MASPPLSTISICSGVGGIELGLSLVLDLRVVCVVEWDAAAAATILARMEEQALDPAPVFCGSVADFNPAPFVGTELLVSGFPCQPHSSAGSRRGTADERWIFEDIARVIGNMGCRAVFLENVPGLSVSGLGEVLGALAQSGMDATWDCFRASDLGAPHARERIFVLGWNDLGAERISDAFRQPVRDGSERGPGRAQAPECRDAESGDVGSDLADADCGRREEFGVAESGNLEGERRGESDRRSAVREFDDRSLWPPGPLDRAAWERIARNDPEILPALEPELLRASEWSPSRMDRLRLVGNCCVPSVAALAFARLAKRAGLVSW